MRFPKSGIHGAKHSSIALNIEKLCFREKRKLEVFDFKTSDDFSVNINWGSADQHVCSN